MTYWVRCKWNFLLITIMLWLCDLIATSKTGIFLRTDLESSLREARWFWK